VTLHSHPICTQREWDREGGRDGKRGEERKGERREGGIRGAMRRKTYYLYIYVQPRRGE